MKDLDLARRIALKLTQLKKTSCINIYDPDLASVVMYARREKGAPELKLSNEECWKLFPIIGNNIMYKDLMGSADMAGGWVVRYPSSQETLGVFKVILVDHYTYWKKKQSHEDQVNVPE